MTIKLVAVAVGAMALSQVAGAQSVFTGLPSDDIFGNPLIGNVPVVNVSADTTAASDMSTAIVSSDDSIFVFQMDNNDGDMATPQSLVTFDASQSPAPAPVARIASTEYQPQRDSSANSRSADLAASADWFDFGMIAAPDLAAVENDTTALSPVAASDVAVETPSENGFERAGADEVFASVHPNVAIPEPGSFGLLLLGGTAFIRFFRRK